MDQTEKPDKKAEKRAQKKRKEVNPLKRLRKFLKLAQKKKCQVQFRLQRDEIKNLDFVWDEAFSFDYISVLQPSGQEYALANQLSFLKRINIRKGDIITFWLKLARDSDGSHIQTYVASKKKGQEHANHTAPTAKNSRDKN